MGGDNHQIDNPCFRRTLSKMARPPKADPAKHKSSVRFNLLEQELLRQLCSLCDPELGVKPNAVLRALVRKEATSRRLVPEPASPPPAVDALENVPDRRSLGARVRHLEDVYKTTVAPHLQQTLLVPPTENVLARIVSQSGSHDSPVVEVLRNDRYYQEVRPQALQDIDKVLTNVEKVWVGFKKS